jgi:DNA-binding response OmpR family regulator
VVIAYEARVGLAAILKRIPNLVLCDVGLPEMSGFEILAAVNRATFGLRRIPFIFLTGWNTREDELKGRIPGADDYVTKPIDFDILEEIVNARLTKGVARHELPAKLPMMIPTGTRAPLKTVPEQIFELTDAPTVDWHPDQATPSPSGRIRLLAPRVRRYPTWSPNRHIVLERLKRPAARREHARWCCPRPRSLLRS